MGYLRLYLFFQFLSGMYQKSEQLGFLFHIVVGKKKKHNLTCNLQNVTNNISSIMQKDLDQET